MGDKYIFSLYSPRADYGTVPTFIDNLKKGIEGFSSLYTVTKETAESIVEAGSAKWFKGVVWGERLWLDFDSYESAERAEEKLRRLGYDFIAYDTGGRGAHFGITRSKTSPSHLLPFQDRKWAKEHFPECDASIYTHLHPFRIAGTTHERTGNKKLLVCEHRGSTLALPKLKSEELSTTQTSCYGNGRSIFDVFRVMANTVPVGNGGRHSALIRLLYSLRDAAAVPPDKALWWVLEWNKMLAEPKDQDEVEKAFKSIYG